MKKFIALLILKLPLSASAIDFAAELESLQYGPVVTCGGPLHEDYFDKGADCTKFITKNGELGPHGRVLRDHLGKINGSRFFDSNIKGMSELCPNWGRFSRQEKEHFWVWFFAAIAREESTCIHTAVAKGVNGTAVGYFQLDAIRKDRYWKSGVSATGKSGEACGVQDVKPPENNIRCALEIFNEQLKGSKGVFDGNGHIAGRDSHTYWQDLRKPREKRVVYKLAGQFPGCR